MSSRIPSRRLGQSALAAFRPRSARWIPSICLSTASRRNVSNPSDPKDANSTKGEPDLTNPVLEKYLQSQQKDAKKTSKQGAVPTLRTGTMNKDPNALFAPEHETSELVKMTEQAAAKEAVTKAHTESKYHSMTLDPDPLARRRLEARLVIRGVKRRGRLTKAENIARTERQSLYKSHALPTSTKKMQKVMNQIAGKSVSEALVQLRFSKKRIARDVVKGLQIAQNEAIAVRGMGLGGGKAAQRRWEKQRNMAEMPGAKATVQEIRKENASGSEVEKSGSALIELKDGARKVIRDPSEIYIDQAWVGKGEMWMSPEFRARGRVNMLRHRTTSFTVLLKEEKTRMRISDEIKKKRDNRKLWVALPDRPVTAQRQYCLW
ncbi:ribosomal protein L22/L17 [Phaeosphaeria sp. MPI-PUGE-AT-0046c]|nr:ribosomal protein L22/L17 [Phaeosphaeria sp. MPI-PUGE-AT-0046c]